MKLERKAGDFTEPGVRPGPLQSRHAFGHLVAKRAASSRSHPEGPRAAAERRPGGRSAEPQPESGASTFAGLRTGRNRLDQALAMVAQMQAGPELTRGQHVLAAPARRTICSAFRTAARARSRRHRAAGTSAGEAGRGRVTLIMPPFKFCLSAFCIRRRRRTFLASFVWAFSRLHKVGSSAARKRLAHRLGG